MTDEKFERVWLITGSSSGFGRLLAEQALAADFPEEELFRAAR